MPYRKQNIRKNHLYHIFSKSIAGYRIFEGENNARRFVETIGFYNSDREMLSFSHKTRFRPPAGTGCRIVKIIAYCLMPTHFHFVIEPLKKDMFSHYMNVVLKSYSRFFNIKHNRKGPLWESRFKHVLVKNDEYLLHLTRYIHLNPVTAYLTDKPEQWPFSSYKEYIGEEKNGFCEFADCISLKPKTYKEFVNDNVGYQRNLAKIKALTLE